MQIIQFRGQTGAFLEPAPGEASLNLLKMAKEGLLYGLRSALHAARKSRAPVRRGGLQVRDGKRWVRVDLEVIPLASTGRMHYLVLFEEPIQRAGRGTKETSIAVTARVARGGKSQVQLLERDPLRRVLGIKVEREPDHVGVELAPGALGRDLAEPTERSDVVAPDVDRVLRHLQHRMTRGSASRAPQRTSIDAW